MSLLDNLNPEQLAAVTLPDQHALILAGAGSGKTRVLTTRIAWLIQTGRTGPAGLLAVTFTNKAAREMLTRISAQLPINTRGMWVGTFHGLCNRFLRAHHREAGYPVRIRPVLAGGKADEEGAKSDAKAGYALRVGGLPSRAEAEALAASLNGRFGVENPRVSR